jgi:hypothetical protein
MKQGSERLPLFRSHSEKDWASPLIAYKTRTIPRMVRVSERSKGTRLQHNFSIN